MRIKSPFQIQSTQSPFAAVWANSQKIRVLVASRRKDESFEILGRGEARMAGWQNGQIVRLGDLTESLGDALEQAEGSCGWKVNRAVVSVEDPKLESSQVTGSAVVKGNDFEITPHSIAQASEAAKRRIQEFQKSVIFSQKIRYVIDDQDEVEDPLGLCGHRLSVVLHLLTCDTLLLFNYRRLCERLGLTFGGLVPPGIAASYSFLTWEERERGVFFVHEGQDLLSVLYVDGNKVREYQVIPSGESAIHGAASRLKIMSGVYPKARDIIIGRNRQGSLMKESLKEGLLLSDSHLTIHERGEHFGSPVRQIEDAVPLGSLQFIFSDPQTEKRFSASNHRRFIPKVMNKVTRFLDEYF